MSSSAHSHRLYRPISVAIIVAMLCSLAPFEGLQPPVANAARALAENNSNGAETAQPLAANLPGRQTGASPVLDMPSTTFHSLKAAGSPPATTAPLAAPPLALELRAEPEGLAPGEIVTFTATLVNGSDQVLSGLALSATLPAGLHHIPNQPGWNYDPPNQRLSAAPGELAAGASVTLSLHLRAAGPVDKAAVLTMEARSGEIEIARASASVWVAHPTRAAIGPQGGALHSSDGRVRVEFPAGAAGARSSHNGIMTRWIVSSG